ncbi:MAG: hypothetical protein ACYC19_09395 [Acidimicrobiales bacterium]
MSRNSDPDERFDAETRPDETPTAMPEGSEIEETPLDVISDTGLEGGVDAVNEESEETEIDPEP